MIKSNRRILKKYQNKGSLTQRLRKVRGRASIDRRINSMLRDVYKQPDMYNPSAIKRLAKRNRSLRERQRFATHALKRISRRRAISAGVGTVGAGALMVSRKRKQQRRK